MIGVLGGTFDPIHFGHLRPALELYELLGLEELRFIPCHIPPHRGTPAVSAEHRLAMVERAIVGVSGFQVDPREILRPGPSYTVDTLLELRREIGPGLPLALLMGADAFAGLPSWYRWREILGLANLVVAQRPGDAARPSATWLDAASVVDSPTALRARASGKVLFQPVTQLDISATRIRACLSAGRSARYLLPDDVCEYIAEHDLYHHENEESE